METENKQIVEKKVYEEGRNRYASEGKGNAALALGIIGTALGAGALWGRGRGLMSGIGADVPENVNITNVSGASGTTAPTAFMAWSRESDDVVALTNELWSLRLNAEREMYAHRETDVREKHELWRAQVQGDFGLYKSQRDLYDVLNERYAEKFNALDKKVAVLEATRPYQDKLIQCEIDRAFTASVNYTDKKTCRAIYGVVGLPSTPTVTVLEGANPFGYNCPAQQSSTPAA